MNKARYQGANSLILLKIPLLTFLAPGIAGNPLENLTKEVYLNDRELISS
jgi:hypothetical protein